jgi:hypothetical protein
MTVSPMIFIRIVIFHAQVCSYCLHTVLMRVILLSVTVLNVVALFKIIYSIF